MEAASNLSTRTARRPLRLAAWPAAAVALIGSAWGAADPAPRAVLSIRLVLKDSSGQVGCMLFSSETGFPKDPGAAAQRRWCPITRAESLCNFDPIPAGTYAVACFHDENGNGKLDTGWFGIPKEGTVASNHATGFMGPPSFDDAKFRFSGKPTELRLRMGY